jgi:hypothetical protein
MFTHNQRRGLAVAGEKPLINTPRPFRRVLVGIASIPSRTVVPVMSDSRDASAARAGSEVIGSGLLPM